MGLERNKESRILMAKTPLSAQVKSILDEHGYVHCTDLPWGKCLYRDFKGLEVAKVSSNEIGMNLIRSEAKGLALIARFLSDAVNLPKGALVLDTPDGVILKMSRVDGVPASKWVGNVVELTPLLAQAQRTERLVDVMAKEAVDSALSQQLVRRFGDIKITTTPSHGDFIYWNVLVGGKQPSLVDFEYTSECRVIGFDDLHYRLAPWMYRWIRWSLPEQLLIWWGLRQARFVCRQNHLSMDPKLLLAMFFVHWAAIRRRWHPKFRPRRVECIERWATQI